MQPHMNRYHHERRFAMHVDHRESYRNRFRLALEDQI